MQLRNPSKATFTVDTLSDDPAAGLTLREALALADSSAGADTIEFAAAIQGGTLRMTGGELTVASDVTIDGGSGVTIDANGLSRVLFVANGSDTDLNEVTLDSLTITSSRLIVGISDGQGREDAGAGIFASKYTSLSLTSSTVSYSAVTGDAVAFGGGIFSAGSLTLTDSTVIGNAITASNTAFGGGISAADVTLTNSLVSNNFATGDLDSLGGGIVANSATLANSTVRFNHADGDYGRGGGIYTRESLTLTDSDVNGNSAAGYGGGILAIGGLDLRDSTVQYNSAAGRGGGIFAAAGSAGPLEVSGSTISGNSTTGADGQGGGIFAAFGGLSLTNSTVTGNSTAGADADGGGIFAQYGTLSVTHSTLTGNSVAGDFADGGGIYVSPRGGDTYQPPAATLTVANSIVAGNEIGEGSGADVFGAIDTSNGHNLFGSAVTGAVAGDIEDADPASIFTTGLLADNGGPTRTIALRNDALNPALSGGIAIAGIDTDQRGADRPSPAGDDPDIGAFELGSATVSVSPTLVAQPEGNSGTTAFTFTVTRTGELASTVSVQGAVTSNEADGADFLGGTLPGGPIVFRPGQTEFVIDLPINGDTTAEPDETFQLVLSNPSLGAVLGNATATGTIRNDDSAPPVDDILGTSRADLLRGTAGADVIRGLAGKDEIRGLAGNDTLYGDAGFDELFGNGGLDKLFGGANGDRFTFLSAGEAAMRGPGYDEIMDFSRTEADKLNLRLIDANAGTSGVNENFAFLGTRALSGPAQVRYEATADGDFLVTGSNDADAAAEFAFIVRTDLTELRGSDFLL